METAFNKIWTRICVFVDMHLKQSHVRLYISKELIALILIHFD